MPRKSTVHIIYFVICIIIIIIMSRVFIDYKVNMKFNVDENEAVRNRFTVFTMAHAVFRKDT